VRFRVSLQPERGKVSLPYNYNHALSSAIFSFLALADATFSHFIHQEGFYHQDKVFKLFTFSPLLSKRHKATREGLLMEGQLVWLVSSPKKEFVANLAQGILQQGFLPLLEQRLMVQQVEVLSQPVFDRSIAFKTLSPVVVSTGQMDSNGSFRKKYLSPEEPEFNRILEENLKRKYQACYGKEPSGEGISLKLLRPPQSKLMDYKGIKVRGWFMHFTIEGDADLVRMGYEAGFGENNSAGFGMVEVAR
jgi:CRISPR-associated endoribonuclease Cas6